jgi:hypothetical protein
LDPSNGRVAGIVEDDFGYFTRIFYEVYLQYYRGGYASRVSEFSRRLLFVVGGDDPIVRTKNVLDAGPPQGITLLQIADVSHFPGGRPRGTSNGGKVESEQRHYWLPEVGRIIANFSKQSEALLTRTVSECWQSRDSAPTRSSGDADGPIDIASPAEPSDQDPTMLASMAFAGELGSLIECSARVSTSPGENTKGWLLVGRNELSPVFLGETAFRFYAQAIHHSEDQIAEYMRVLRERAKRLEQLRPRLSMLVPKECSDRLEKPDGWTEWQTVWQTVFAKSETPSAARIPSEDELSELWQNFETVWRAPGAVGMVEHNEYEPEQLGAVGIAEADRLKLRRLPLTILPDAWIALSGNASKGIRGEASEDNRSTNEEAIVNWATRLIKDLKRNSGDEEQPDLELLEDLIDGGEVIAITVSGAELNPRYRGHKLLEARDVARVLIHWALAYRASNLSTYTTASAST